MIASVLNVHPRTAFFAKRVVGELVEWFKMCLVDPWHEVPVLGGIHDGEMSTKWRSTLIHFRSFRLFTPAARQPNLVNIHEHLIVFLLLSRTFAKPASSEPASRLGLIGA